MKLSIAIATYNRAGLLRETVENIAGQIHGYSDIEIVISDNASIDNTQETVKKLQEKYPYIKYFRNDTNLGAERNFCNAVERSEGEYVWLFSDDDKMQDNSIDYIMDILRQYEDLAVIHLNWGAYDENLQSCYQDKVLKIGKDTLFSNADDFLAATNMSPIFISSLIINRMLWLQTDRSEFLGTGWVHFGTIHKLLIANQDRYRSLVVSHPFIMQRAGNHWQTDQKEGGLELGYIALPKMILSLQNYGFAKKSIREPLSELYKHLGDTIISVRIQNGGISKTKQREIMKTFGRFPVFWIMVFPLFYMPSKLLSFIEHLNDLRIAYLKQA